MKKLGTFLAVGAVITCTQTGFAQKKSGSENGLLGIKLYDSGLKVVNRFGTPDSIEAVNVGGVSSIGGGGQGGPGAPGNFGGGGPGGPAGVGGPPTRGGGGASPELRYDFGFADELLQQGSAFAPPPKRNPGQNRGGGNPPLPGAGGGGGIPGPGGPPFNPGGGAPGGAAGSSGKIIFTRWVYKRNGSRYGFIFDKFNRVVQIEAIGLHNGSVRTKRGISFGNTFATIIRKYSRNPDGSSNPPDGYEVSGETIVVRYLVNNKVAFRLSRLAKDRPQVVTGIVVAAGKI